jgi:dihydroorotate dehydrogenase
VEHTGVEPDIVTTAKGIASGMPIIASGGIFGRPDVAEAYAAGADLVQLWTGLVYVGPGLIGQSALVAHNGA